MAERKEKYSFDDLKRLGDEKREDYDLTMEQLYPKKIVKINDKEVDIGKKCREWYQTIYDYAPDPNDSKLTNLVAFIQAAYKDGANLDDKTTKTGRRWDFLMNHYYKLGMNFRITMDQTKNELTRLLTRK
jgi:hypothetical protein